MSSAFPFFLRRALLAGLALLAGCVFETRAPREAPLVLDSTFSRFDPLIALFVDTSGDFRDTLYHGPGGAARASLRMDGLPDRGWIRLEGYQGRRLAYRLDIPWPADTLFAQPRWTPVGPPLWKYSFDHASLSVWKGVPTVLASDDIGNTDIARLEDGDWNWIGTGIKLPDDVKEWLSRTGAQIQEDAEGLWMLSADPTLEVRRRKEGEWAQLLPARRFYGERIAASLDSGLLAVSAYAPLRDTTYFALYAAVSGWARTETRYFPGYRIPQHALDYTTINPCLAQSGGRTALALADSAGRVTVFSRRDGAWDSARMVPERLPVSGASVAIAGEWVYLAFEKRTFDSVHGHWADPRVVVRRWGPGGIEEVGPPDLFGRYATAAHIRIRAGVPHVGARNDAGRFMLARWQEGRWKVLVEPRFNGFEEVHDFHVDETGVPYVVGYDGDSTRVAKFVDPDRPR